MDYHCLLQCGVNCNSTETISTERWKQLETKTKLPLRQSRKRMGKGNAEKTPTIFEQQEFQEKECQLNVWDHHLNVSNLQLAGLYIIRINAFDDERF